MSNAKMTYLYRDAGNYKRWAEVIFSNAERLQSDAAIESVNKALTADGLFIASQIRLAEAFLSEEYPINSYDHCFHEFYSLAATEEPPSDSHGRSLTEFLEEMCTEARRGWMVFDVS